MFSRLYRALTGTPYAVNSPASPQFAPLYWRPEWHVEHLVFQGGIPILKRSSMTGGGFLPMRDLAGKEAPMWQPLATPVSSLVGSGLLPSRPTFLAPLANGTSTGSGV